MIKLRPSLEVGRQCTMGRKEVIGAEIGVLGGTNAVGILENWPNVRMLHLVDSYGGITDQDPKFVEWVKRFDSLKDRMTWHIKTSIKAAFEFEDNSLDFVYIDANHIFANVKIDINLWYRKVKPNGILAGHDYFTFGSVKRAVDQFVGWKNLWLFTTDPDWWIFKE